MSKIMIEEEYRCPLGKQCEEIIDNKLVKCMWLVELKGEDPQTGADVDNKMCAIAAMPLLMTETARQTRNAQSAVESMRNSTSNLNKILLGAMEETKKLQ